MYLANLEKMQIDKAGKADMFNYEIDWPSIELNSLSLQKEAIKNASSGSLNH